MGNLLKYSGIVTKVKAMSSTLLSEDDFLNISQASNVLDIVNYLKKHPAYSVAFESFDERLLHRADIEKILNVSLYEDYTKMYRFGDQHIRNFLMLYMKRYEIDLITYCFRIVFNHYEEPFDLGHKKPFFDKYSQISIDSLITSTSEEELIDHLKETEYYLPLKTIRDTKNASLFDYNLALDLHYYSTIWKERKKVLRKSELNMFTKDTGCKADLLNLQWIYRAKKYYNMSLAEIYSFLIPIHFHIHNEEMRALVEAPTVEDFIKLVHASYYGRHYYGKGAFTLEQSYHSCLSHLYSADCRSNPYSIAPINMYLYRREEEIKKITTALECIRYGVASRETLKYIGGIAQ